MNKIIATNGIVATVDEDDYSELSKHNWCITHGYVARASKRSDKNYKKNGLVFMHRCVMNCPDGMVVDHINHDTLDNRKENLRICTRAQNTYNRKGKSNGSSIYKGVSWSEASGKWGVVFDKKWIGVFENEIEAARAYDELAIKYYGEYAYINNV